MNKKECRKTLTEFQEVIEEMKFMLKHGNNKDVPTNEMAEIVLENIMNFEKQIIKAFSKRELKTLGVDESE